MVASVEHLLSKGDFMPHGTCFLWQPGILGLHVVSDSLITLAYFSIPFTLLHLVRRRADLQFNWMFVCFAIFIVACGSTHLMEIWTIWYPAYWLSGSIKALTALASVPTAVLLIKLVPAALRVPSPSDLHNVNMELVREVAERKRAEDEVRRINAQLEARVAERTVQLEAANRSLVQEDHERRRAEQTMRSSRHLLQAIVDNSLAVIYAKDLEGRYLLVNRRFEDIFHRSREAILGRTDYDFFSKEAADAFRSMDVRVAAAGHALTEEETVLQVDGPHVFISIKAPLSDTEGIPYAVFGISTDITERKHGEKRLRAQLERLSLLDRTTRAIGERQNLRSIFQVVIRSLEEHLPIDFSCICLYEPPRQALEIVCVGVRNQLMALDLLEHERIDVDENGLGRCVRGQLVYESDIEGSTFSFPARLARGGLRSLVIAPLIVKDKVFGVMVAARQEPGSFTSGDCEFLRQLSEHIALAAHQAQLYAALQQAYEELRQTQQTVMQQERLRALGQMASGIAHDINNALSPASLYVQSMLERDPTLGQGARQHLTIIQRAIEDVAGTVARMREFSRPREHDFTLAPVDLNAMLQQVAELTRARWGNIPQERGIVIHLRTDLAPNLPAIMGAENEIRDALTNLVLNAVDAMPDGGTLTLRSRMAENIAGPSRDITSAERVRVEICDTGAGMTEAVRSRCLEPFFTTKGERGTGLGLAMVYGMVQRHSAKLEIDSEPGRGTTVRVMYPIAQTRETAVRESPVRPVEQLRILVVDDDPLVLRSLRDILESDGHFVRAADGGQGGIDDFFAARERREPYAAVITDLGMPNTDGRTVAAAIKSASPTTPVILLTGWGHRLLADKELPEHVDRVLSKPPRLAELRAALAELTLGTKHTNHATGD